MLLLKLQAGANEEDDQGTRPLYFAAIERHTAVVAALWKHRADVNAQGGHFRNGLQTGAI